MRQLGITLIVVILAGLSAIVLGGQTAIASSCTTTSTHTVCLLSVKRSAKQFWEYRAAVTVDGVERAVEIYNCRDRQRIRADGRVVTFEPGGAGEVICRKLYRPVRSPLN